MNEVMQTILTRRSIRAFTDQNIEKDVLRQLADAARYAPSAMNRQTWKFTVVSNAKYIHALASAISAHLNRGGDYNFYGATALILASNEKDNPHGTEDCACALEDIFLAAHSLGIGSVWINQLKGICDVPDIREVLDELHLPKNHLVLGMAALGYPAVSPAFPSKRDDVVEYIE